MSYLSRLPGIGHGVWRTVRSEWTKLRSLRSTAVSLLLVVGLSVLMAVLGASGSTTDANKTGPQPVFGAQLAYHELTGDGEIVVHVTSQQRTGPDAKAGVMITDQGPGGSTLPTFAAVFVTPDHGVEWLGGFTQPTQDSDASAPRWLKLRRVGGTIEGFESADGQTWDLVGSADLADLPSTARIGMFATSPPVKMQCRRESAGSTSCGPLFETSTAAFDSVTVAAASGQPLDQPWRHTDTSGSLRKLPGSDVQGSFTEADGVYRVSGAGDIGLAQPGGDDDIVREVLGGAVVGFIALAVLSAVFVTGEFRRGLARTTFTASPRRSRVLTAKVLVIGSVSFLAGTVAAMTAFLASRPIMLDHGFGPPAYPDLSLTDGRVVRAVLGTGLTLALLAVLAVALGTVLRRTAWTVTLVVGLVILPLVIGPFLSLSGEAWLRRVTPAAGFALQQTRPRFDDFIDPWAGAGVLAAYVAVALALAYWRLNRQDV